jgi:hypothetical protein
MELMHNLYVNARVNVREVTTGCDVGHRRGLAFLFAGQETGCEKMQPSWPLPCPTIRKG